MMSQNIHVFKHYNQTIMDVQKKIWKYNFQSFIMQGLNIVLLQG